MKRSEIEIGKVYAYSRTAEPKSPYEISGFVVESLEPVKDWRGNIKQEVKGKFTNPDGTLKTHESDSTTVNIRKLIGDYLSLKHDLEIRAKNREIAQLNKQIASTRVEGLINKHAEIITQRIKIDRYAIRNNYDGKAVITLTADQLQELVWAFQALARHEEHAQRLEAERIQKAYEESQETVNA
jgi:hypothetical protein